MGSVNSLFSGMAFATLIYTIHLERNLISELEHEATVDMSVIRNRRL